MLKPITEAEYREHRANYDGVCLGCGDWTTGGVEPDARHYRCEACGAHEVYGIEEAIILDRLQVEDEE